MIDESFSLLRAWVEQGSEESFARLVARYVDLVHSTALRKTAGNTGIAQEITQSVFVDLARKAPGLSREGSLAGWLHRHTCYVAASTMRAEGRRHAREQAAATMHQMNSLPEYEQAAPLLDDAINALSAEDRQAILLRFYEKCDLRGIGVALGVGEDAAQKRVSRALDKLRAKLAKEGLTSTTATLTSVLATHSVTAAPAGLAYSSAAAAIAAKTTALIPLTFIEIMTHAKAKAAVGLALVAMATVPVVWQETQIANARAENQTERNRSEVARQQAAAGHFQATELDEPSTAEARELEELQTLRAEIASLRNQMQQAKNARQALLPSSVPKLPTSASGAAEGKLISMRDLRDFGNASGEAAVQTALWAMFTANTNRLAQLFDYSAEGAREQLGSLLKHSSEIAQERQRMIDVIEFRTRIQIPKGNGDLTVVMEMFEGGTNQGPEQFLARPSIDGWRIVLDKSGTAKGLTDEQMDDLGFFDRDHQ